MVSGRIEPTNTAEYGSFDVERTEATKMSNHATSEQRPDLCRKLYCEVSGNRKETQTQNLHELHPNSKNPGNIGRVHTRCRAGTPESEILPHINLREWRLNLRYFVYFGVLFSAMILNSLDHRALISLVLWWWHGVSRARVISSTPGIQALGSVRGLVSSHTELPSRCRAS